MALKGIAETNKSPLKSTRKGLVVIPYRFLTGASTPTSVVAPGSDGSTGATGVFTITRTSSTVYVIRLPGLRIAASTVGTGSTQTYLQWHSADTTAAEYISSAVFASDATNNTTTVTLTFSGAPANGTQVRGVIQALAVGVQ